MELPQNLLQTFACVASEKKLPTKNGVASKFIANFCLCSIRKKFPTKNGVASKLMANIRFFLLLYTWFSNIVNDSASLHRLIIKSWHFVFQLVFPSEFPFKPPSIYMTTPSGRFKTNTRLCLSISDYHPDTWNPAWSVGTILTGLLSFMLEKSPTLGSIETSEAVKRRFAVATHEFNLQNKVYLELFPGM